MMDPAKLQRARAAFALLRESITVVKGLKEVMAAPQAKTANETSEAPVVAADISMHSDSVTQTRRNREKS
jgi:hypothetical protein